MLEKAYGAELLPAVGLYDLLWQLESLAQKFGIERKGAFPRFKREIRSFSSERTALANGVNGKRFYLMQDSQALRWHDETHIFQVGFDGGGDTRGGIRRGARLPGRRGRRGATSTATCILQTGPIGAPQTEKRTPSPNGSEWACSC